MMMMMMMMMYEFKDFKLLVCDMVCDENRIGTKVLQNSDHCKSVSRQYPELNVAKTLS